MTLTWDGGRARAAVSDYQYIRYEPAGNGDDGQIVVITLDRPDKLNAISSAVAGEFARAFRRFAESDAFVAIVAGAGRAFCAGMDVMENLAAGRSTMQAPDIGDDYNVFWPGETSGEQAPSLMKGQHRRLDKLVIAAVHGYACGGGFLMAMAADLCVAAESTVFEVSEVPRGLVAGWTWVICTACPATWPWNWPWACGSAARAPTIWGWSTGWSRIRTYCPSRSTWPGSCAACRGPR